MRKAVILLAVLLASCGSGEAAAVPCDLSQMSGTMVWESAAGALTGQMELTNNSGAACTLSGQPYIAWADGVGNQMAVEEVLIPGPDPAVSVVLEPSQSAASYIAWRNWCGPMPEGGIVLAIELPDHPGRLSVAASNPGGALTVPQCDSQATSSTVSVEAFVASGD
jgi:hypothetical protein